MNKAKHKRVHPSLTKSDDITCLWLSHVHHLHDFVSIPPMLPKLLWMVPTRSGDLWGCPATDLGLVSVSWQSWMLMKSLPWSFSCLCANSHLWSSDSGEFVMGPVCLIQREDTVWLDWSMHLPFPYPQIYPITAMAAGPSLPCLWIIRHVSYLMHKVRLWLKLAKNCLKLRVCCK